MKKTIEKILEDKRIFSIYIVVFCMLTIGITYAANINASLAYNVNTSLIGVDEDAYGNTTFNFDNIDFIPILDSDVETKTNNVIKIDFVVGGANTNNASNIIYDIALADLEVDCNLLSPYIKWKLVKDGTLLSNGSLDYNFDTIKNGRLVLTNIQEDLPTYSATKSGYHSYTFYMWFSDSCQEEDLTTCMSNNNLIDQSSLNRKQLSGKVEVELYTHSKKALVRKPSDRLDVATCIGESIPNKPNLDNGNLIPVYFDETVGTYGSWMKADSSNSDNSWYDYYDNKWANAIVVDPSKLDTYQKANVGEQIAEADIIAFYVWIPRFKYRVWNINRQGTSEDYYAYPAFTNGIQIEFEKGTASTGNVICSYDVGTRGSATYLSDNCSVNGTAVSYDTANSTYGDSNPAWYTHPAFTFGDGTDKNKTGFWIGKFETSTITTSTCYTTPDATNCDNTNQEPRILPDVSSLRNQTVSNQFMTAVKFQGYLSSNVDAHMLTNLEWGAVAYLTHSIYGLCDGSSCGGVYINNSTGTSCQFTGRSGGAIAGSSDLNLVNVYGSSVTTSTTKYNCNGYYDYKGYKLDYNTGNPTTKDITKIASTTGNITGVYDMSGGSMEYVMGNMVNTSGVFYPSNAGSAWSSTNWYDTVNSSLYSKYYNAYAYGVTVSGAVAFNRSRLGDATAEVLGGTASNSSWKPGSGGAITGSFSYFVYSSDSWFTRGGYSNDTYSSSYNFFNNLGSSSSYYSFRSSLA